MSTLATIFLAVGVVLAAIGLGFLIAVVLVVFILGAVLLGALESIFKG